MPFHQQLYDFWLRSTGVWISPLLTLNISWLNKSEILAIAKIHHLEQVEFGISMSWEYCKKPDSDYMSWCVDAKYPDVVFTDKSISHNSPPSIFNYQLRDANRLVMTVGKYEETIVLESYNRRWREQRYEGKLMRRLREEKADTISPKLALAS
jgi:hydroxypyruvate isomerase